MPEAARRSAGSIECGRRLFVSPRGSSHGTAPAPHGGKRPEPFLSASRRGREGGLHAHETGSRPSLAFVENRHCRFLRPLFVRGEHPTAEVGSARLKELGGVRRWCVGLVVASWARGWCP